MHAALKLLPFLLDCQLLSFFRKLPCIYLSFSSFVLLFFILPWPVACLSFVHTTANSRETPANPSFLVVILCFPSSHSQELLSLQRLLRSRSTHERRMSFFLSNGRTTAYLSMHVSVGTYSFSFLQASLSSHFFTSSFFSSLCLGSFFSSSFL